MMGALPAPISMVPGWAAARGEIRSEKRQSPLRDDWIRRWQHHRRTFNIPRVNKGGAIN